MRGALRVFGHSVADRGLQASSTWDGDAAAKLLEELRQKQRIHKMARGNNIQVRRALQFFKLKVLVVRSLANDNNDLEALVHQRRQLT